jgi:hypothetical protein
VLSATDSLGVTTAFADPSKPASVSASGFRGKASFDYGESGRRRYPCGDGADVAVEIPSLGILEHPCEKCAEHLTIVCSNIVKQLVLVRFARFEAPEGDSLSRRCKHHLDGPSIVRETTASYEPAPVEPEEYVRQGRRLEARELSQLPDPGRDMGLKRDQNPGLLNAERELRILDGCALQSPRHHTVEEKGYELFELFRQAPAPGQSIG